MTSRKKPKFTVEQEDTKKEESKTEDTRKEDSNKVKKKKVVDKELKKNAKEEQVKKRKVKKDVEEKEMNEMEEEKDEEEKKEDGNEEDTEELWDNDEIMEYQFPPESGETAIYMLDDESLRRILVMAAVLLRDVLRHLCVCKRFTTILNETPLLIEHRRLSEWIKQESNKEVKEIEESGPYSNINIATSVASRMIKYGAKQTISIYELRKNNEEILALAALQAHRNSVFIAVHEYWGNQKKKKSEALAIAAQTKFYYFQHYPTERYEVHADCESLWCTSSYKTTWNEISFGVNYKLVEAVFTGYGANPTWRHERKNTNRHIYDCRLTIKLKKNVDIIQYAEANFVDMDAIKQIYEQLRCEHLNSLDFLILLNIFGCALYIGNRLAKTESVFDFTWVKKDGEIMNSLVPKKK